MTDTVRKAPARTFEITPMDVPSDIDKEVIQTAGPFNNISYYIGYGIFTREFAAITNLVSVGFFIAAAAEAIRESQYLGAGELGVEGGHFNAGQNCYRFFFIAAILSCISNGIALFISFIARVNTVVQLWWPEHRMVDILLQLVYVGFDIGAIILAGQAFEIYTPVYFSLKDDVDCSKELYKFSCDTSYQRAWRSVYAFLLVTSKDQTEKIPVDDSMYEREVPHFSDVITTFAVIYGVRFGLSLLILAWANYKPFYILGFNRSVCDSVGCGNRDGKPTNEHVECGWSLGGLFSKWANDQLGSLRNHDWVGSLFFFVAFLVLSNGLHDEKVSGAYIPKTSVMEARVTKVSKNSQMQTFVEQTFKVDDEIKGCGFNYGILIDGNGNVHSDALLSLYTYKTIGGENSNELHFPNGPIATVPNSVHIQLSTKGTADQSVLLPENQQSCVNEKSYMQENQFISDTIVLGHTKIIHKTTNTTVDYKTGTSDGNEETKAATMTDVKDDLGQMTTTDVDTAIKDGVNNGHLVITQQCCGKGNTFEESISSRFETYSILLLVGSIFYAISALAYFVGLTFYNVRARPLSLREPDGGYAMTVI